MLNKNMKHTIEIIEKEYGIKIIDFILCRSDEDNYDSQRKVVKFKSANMELSPIFNYEVERDIISITIDDLYESTYDNELGKSSLRVIKSQLLPVMRMLYENFNLEKEFGKSKSLLEKIIHRLFD